MLALTTNSQVVGGKGTTNFALAFVNEQTVLVKVIVTMQVQLMRLSQEWSFMHALATSPSCHSSTSTTTELVKGLDTAHCGHWGLKNL